MIKSRVYQLLRRTPFRRHRRLLVFETDVGVKYKYDRLGAGWGRKFVRRKASCGPQGVALSDLVMPPDLLRNEFTSCGRPLTESLHRRLMEEIETGTLTARSEYLTRLSAGTLDARRPVEGDPGQLARRYAGEKKKMGRERGLVVYVAPVDLDGERRYALIDGKHRAALAAYHGRPDALRVHVLSAAFTRLPLVQRIYSFVLSLDAERYSINQRMIRAIVDES